jgi:hypothetical protein
MPDPIAAHGTQPRLQTSMTSESFMLVHNTSIDPDFQLGRPQEITKSVLAPRAARIPHCTVRQ